MFSRCRPARPVPATRRCGGERKEKATVCRKSASAQAIGGWSNPTASGRPRIYDASEGTKFDPLLNKTYDLSYAKVVPTRQ